MKRSKFLSKVIGGIATLATIPVGWLIAKNPIRTTKGIIPYIQEHQSEMMPVSEFSYEEWLKAMDKVFQYSGAYPKMLKCAYLKCAYCLDWVKVPDNCSCGRIWDVGLPLKQKY